MEDMGHAQTTSRTSLGRGEESLSKAVVGSYRVHQVTGMNPGLPPFSVPSLALVNLLFLSHHQMRIV